MENSLRLLIVGEHMGKKPGKEESFEELAEKAKDDPLFRFLSSHYKHILLSIAVIGIGFYLYAKYQETKELSLRRASDLLASARASYLTLTHLVEERKRVERDALNRDEKKDGEGVNSVKEIDKKIKEEKEKLLLKLSALRQEREPFNLLAVLYQTQMYSFFSQYGKALSLIDSVLKEKTHSEGVSFLVELAMFQKGRILAHKGEKEKAVSVFRSLVKGNYFGIPALLELNYLGYNGKELKALKDEILKREPFQEDLIRQYINLS